MSLSELFEANVDAVCVLTNPGDHLTAPEPGLHEVGGHRWAPQYPQGVTYPELVRCGLRSSLPLNGNFFRELPANIPRHSLPPRKELHGIHYHTVN